MGYVFDCYFKYYNIVIVIIRKNIILSFNLLVSKCGFAWFFTGWRLVESLQKKSLKQSVLRVNVETY